VHPDAELDSANGFTVAVWINRTDGFSGCPVNKGYGTTENNSWQACLTADGMLSFYSEGSATGHAQPSPDPLPAGQWHHVALWWNGTTKATYIDGVRTAQNDLSIAFDADDITIGADLDDGNVASPFTGMLDDVRVYNRALSDAEITALQSP
jgi:hypothetical protein